MASDGAAGRRSRGSWSTATSEATSGGSPSGNSTHSACSVCRRSRLGVVEEQVDGGHDRRREPGARGYCADLRRPRGGRVEPAHGDALGHRGHHGRGVLAERGRRRGRCCRRRRRGVPDGLGGDRAGSAIGHQGGDLLTGQRTAEVGHRPAAGEGGRLVLAGLAQHELALVEPGDGRAHRRDVDAAGRRRQAVEQARLVLLGLQPPDQPGARVATAPCSRRRPGSAWRAPCRPRTPAPA